MVKGVLTATNITGRPAVNYPKFIIRAEEVTGHREDDDSRPADYDFPDLAHPGQMNMHIIRQWSVPFVTQTWMAQSDGLGMQQHRRRGTNSPGTTDPRSRPVDTRGNRLIPMVMAAEHGQMGAHMRTCLDEMATHLVNRPGGIPMMMRGTFGVWCFQRCSACCSHSEMGFHLGLGSATFEGCCDQWGPTAAIMNYYEYSYEYSTGVPLLSVPYCMRSNQYSYGTCKYVQYSYE